MEGPTHKEKIHDIIKWFRSSILGEYALLFLVVAGLGGSFYLASQFISDKAGVSEEKSQSGDYVPIPSIGISEEYAEYAKTFQVYESDFGFSFKYPPHLEVFKFCDNTCWIVLSVKDNNQQDDSGKIILSIAENDEQMTAEEWFLGDGGYSKENYGNYYKTRIDGQEAVYTDGGMWTVVNTPNNKYRLSIADLSTGNAMPLFSEMGIIIESLSFVGGERK